MSSEDNLKTGAGLLAPWTLGSKTPEANRMDIMIDAASVPAAVKTLADARWGYLVAITGLDYLGKTAQFAQDARWKALLEAGTAKPDSGVLEVLYFLSNGPAMIVLRALIVREAASVPSVCDIIPSATFFERELSEMFGITIQNSTDPSHLFLPENWGDGVYPLRKDFVPQTIA